MSKISFNIRHLRELKKLSQERLADELNITRARLGAYEEGRNEPPLEILLRLSDYFHISVDALLRGDLRKTDPSLLMNVGHNRILFPVITTADNQDQIEVVTAKVSAGYLNGYSDPEYIERLPSMKLPFRITGKHRSFPVKGDSMPPLKTGDYVIGRFVESLSEVQSGKTYVMLTREEGIVYKRLYRIKNQRIFGLHSDNRSYAPYHVHFRDILEIWEFVCCLKTSDTPEEEISLESVMTFLRSMKVELESIRKK